MKYLLIMLIALTMSVSCDRNACRLQYDIINQTVANVNIAPVDSLSIQFSPWFGDTIIIESFTTFYNDFGLTDVIPQENIIFSGHDSIAIIFDNRNEIIHYRDSTKGDYSHSIFNMDSYEEDGCKFTYTFTQEDYERAKAVK